MALASPHLPSWCCSTPSYMESWPGTLSPSSQVRSASEGGSCLHTFKWILSRLPRCKLGPFLSRAAERSWRKTTDGHDCKVVAADSSDCCPAQRLCPIVVMAELVPEALLHLAVPFSELLSPQTLLQGRSWEYQHHMWLLSTFQHRLLTLKWSLGKEMSLTPKVWQCLHRERSLLSPA